MHLRYITVLSVGSRRALGNNIGGMHRSVHGTEAMFVAASFVHFTEMQDNHTKRCSCESGVTKSVQFSVVCVVRVRLGSSHMFIHSEISVADVQICCGTPFHEMNEMKGGSASLAEVKAAQSVEVAE
jgi:hypothetical protein